MPSTLKSSTVYSLSHQLLWGCFVLNMLCVQVYADEQDTLQFRSTISRVYDDNLFRRASNESRDQITRTTLGLKVDKTYSLQRVILDAWVVDNQYQKNDYLDFVGKNYSATYLWSLTPSLTGTLSSRQTESMNNFGDYLNANKNIRTNTSNQFSAKYSPHKVWGFIFGATQTKVENSQIFTALSDFDAKGIDYGISYDFASGAFLKVLAHNSTGTMAKRPLDAFNTSNAFDNGYKETKYDIDLFVPVDGKSKFSAEVGYIDREYDHFSVRNWSALVGNATYDLMITGKISSNFVLARTASPFETVNSTYSVYNTFTSRVTYDYSSKIAAGLNLRYALRDFEGRAQFDTSGRNDKEYSFGGYISWNPIKNIGISLNSTKSFRNSNVARFDYDDTLTSINFDLKI